MKNNKMVPIKETMFILLGEVLVSVLVCIAFLILQKYDISVLLGCLIGSAVIVLNFFFMSVAVNRAIDDAFSLRENYVDEPSASPVPEEAESSEADAEDEENGEEKLDAAMRFAKEQSVRINRISKTSYIIRTATVVLALVVALISGWFHPIATVIPMLMFRPLIMADGLIRRKK